MNLGKHELNKFTKGDKILVIGGFQHEWNVINMNTYGSIVKTERIDLTDPTIAFRNPVYFKHFNVGKSITEEQITVVLHALDFTPIIQGFF